MTSCLPAEGAFTAAFSVDNPGKMLTSGTGKDECNPHVWIWCQIHNSSGKVSSSSEIYSHSISAENSLGRAGERSVMQVKETKGRKTFWPWAEDLQWACSCCPLRGDVHLQVPWPCRSWPCLELAERALLRVPSRAPAVLPLCQPGFAPSPCSCCSGSACPVLQSLSHSFPFLMAQSRASLAKLDVRSMHWNGGVRVVSTCLKWCSCKPCLFRNMLCYGRV